MGSSNILIKLVLEGFNKAKAQMNNLGKKTDESGGKLSKFGTVAKIGAVAVGTVLVKALSEATRQFIDFEDKLNQSLAIMQTTEEQQLAMARASRQVAIESRISASESAEAFFFLASAGLDAEQSISALPQVTKFAQAGMFDMALATDLATDSQSALGLTVKDAEQNLTNLTRVTDVLVKANTLANASVQQFAEALTTKSGSALKVANKQIEEGVAVLSAFADRGVKGAEAGEKLNQLIRDTTRAVGKNADVFKQYNIDILDNEGNLKNLADVIEELDRGMEGMSDQQKAVLLDQLGLNRGVADAVKILSGAGDQIRAYEQALSDAGGTTEDVANKQIESLKGQSELLGSKFDELGMRVVDVLVPALKSAVEQLNLFLDGLLKIGDGTHETGDTQEQLAKNFDIVESSAHSSNSALNDKLIAEKQLRDITNIRNQQTVEYYENLYQQGLIEKDLITNAHELDRETGNLNDTKEEGIELTEEEIEAEKKLAKDRATAGLDALKNLNDAYQTLRDMEQERLDLIDKEAEALTKLNKENEKLQQANEKVTKAKEDFEKVSGLGAKVTNEEALAIARQKEEIAKLEAEEEKSEVQKLQLAVARERLNQLIEQSTAISREEEQALRNIERAEKDVITQTERGDKAQKKYQDAQEELAKATANSTENILEQAIAKAELDNALADVSAMGVFADGVNEIARLVGADIEFITNQFSALMNLGRQAVRDQTMPEVSNAVIDDLEDISENSKAPTEKGKGRKFGILGEADQQFISDFAERTGGRVGTGAGNTIITVNTGSLLGTSEDVQLAVSEAIKQAQRKGIDVAL